MSTVTDQQQHRWVWFGPSHQIAFDEDDSETNASVLSDDGDEDDSAMLLSYQEHLEIHMRNFTSANINWNSIDVTASVASPHKNHGPYFEIPLKGSNIRHTLLYPASYRSLKPITDLQHFAEILGLTSEID